MANEIKLGMSICEHKLTGNILYGFGVRTFDKFAKEIHLKDVYSMMGGENNLSEEERNIVNKLFNKISNIYTNDGYISEYELQTFFNKLDAAAASDRYQPRGTDLLAMNELITFTNEFCPGIIPNSTGSYITGSDTNERYTVVKFIEALVKVNDKNYEKDQADAADLASRTTQNPDGTTTVRQYDSVENEKTQWTKKFNGDKLIEESWLNPIDNTKYTITYENGKKIKEVHQKGTLSWTTTYKDGLEDTLVTEDKKDKSKRIKKFYYEDRNLVRTSETSNDGWTTTEYYERGFRVEEVRGNAEGYLEDRYYEDRNHSWNPARVVTTETNGRKTTQYYTYNSQGKVIKEVEKDNNDNDKVLSVITHTYGSNNTETITERDGQGNLVLERKFRNNHELTKTTYSANNTREVITYKIIGGTEKEVKQEKYEGNELVETVETSYNRNGLPNLIVTRRGDVVVQTVEISYDNRNREAKTVTRNGDVETGTIAEITNVSYPARNKTRTETVNEMGQIVRISNQTQERNRLYSWTNEFYKNGMLLCKEIHDNSDKNNKTVTYENKYGQVISKEDFYKLKREYYFAQNER